MPVVDGGGGGARRHCRPLGARPLHMCEPRVRSLAMGVSAHGACTSRVLAEGLSTGAFSALAAACPGVLTALLTPVGLRVMG